MSRAVATLAVAVLVALLALAGGAAAAGGNYIFSGGTPGQRAEVRAALDAQFLGQMQRRPALLSTWSSYRHP